MTPPPPPGPTSPVVQDEPSHSSRDLRQSWHDGLPHARVGPVRSVRPRELLAVVDFHVDDPLVVEDRPGEETQIITLIIDVQPCRKVLRQTVSEPELLPGIQF